MKVLKVLGIAYLAWALLYSLTGGRAWVKDALVFKLNGGPQLVWQLNSAGFSVVGAQVDAKNKFLGLSLSRQNIPHGRLDYDWSDAADIKAKEQFEAYEKDRLPGFRQFIRIERSWAIWAAQDERTGGKFSIIKKTVEKLKISPNKAASYPSSEYQFLNSNIKGKIFRPVIPDALNRPTHWLSAFTIYPVLALHALIIAYSSSKIVTFTAYLPIALFLVPLIVVAKRRWLT